MRRIGLFGSFAKGLQKEDSDIDILVELDEPSFYKMAYVQIFLEEHFGRKIDVHFEKRLSFAAQIPAIH